MSRNNINSHSIKTVACLMVMSSFVIGAPAVTSTPDVVSEDVLIVKALLSEERQDFNQSRKIFDALYRMTGDKTYLMQEAKDVLMQKGDPRHSIDNLTTWMRENPADKDVALYRILMALYIQQGDLVEAERFADQYLSGNIPVKERAVVASLKLELGKAEEAAKILHEAYKENFDEVLLLREVIVLEKYLSNPPKAISLLEVHIKAHKESSVAIYFKLIELYAKEKKLDKVLMLYKKLYERSPQKYFLKKIIEISLYQKDIDGIITFLEKNQNNEEILYTFYKEKKEYDKAIMLAQKLYEKSSQPKWLAEQGMLVYEKARSTHKVSLKRLRAMQNLLEEALAKGVTASIYLNYYGYTLIDHDLDVDRGLDLVRKALKQQPTNAFYLDSLAWGLYKKGECKKAYPIMKSVVKKEGLKEEEIKLHWEMIRKCGEQKPKLHNRDHKDRDHKKVME